MKSTEEASRTRFPAVTHGALIVVLTAVLMAPGVALAAEDAPSTDRMTPSSWTLDGAWGAVLDTVHEISGFFSAVWSTEKSAGEVGGCEIECGNRGIELDPGG